MFKLNNLHNSADLEIEISYNDIVCNFNIKTIVNKRNKDEMDDSIQFDILEAYLDYKGDGFKTALMNEYVKSEEVLSDSIGGGMIMSLPYELVNGIYSLFDINDVIYFVKDVYRLKAPNTIIDQFDDRIVKDGRGTRVQTYIKDEYLELIALVQVLKTVIGPIGEYADMNLAELGKDNIHHQLFSFFTNSWIIETPSYQKLYGMIDLTVESVNRMGDEASARVIEKGIAKDDMTNWVMSIAIIQKIAMAAISNGHDSKDIISRTYNFVNNKLKVKGDTSNALRSKTTGISDADGEGESKLEQYRITSSLPIGTIVEIEVALMSAINDPYNVGFSFTYDDDVYIRAKSFAYKIIIEELTQMQIILLSWIFKRIIDPRAIMYAKAEVIRGLLALAFAKLWHADFKYLALLLTSNSVKQDDTVVISFTTNRSRITKELKEKLDEIFPYKKIVVTAGVNRENNVAEVDINNIADNIYKNKWAFTADVDMVEEVLNNKALIVNVVPDLKIRLAELVIYLNREIDSTIVN